MKPLSAIATVKHVISTSVYGTSAVTAPRVFFLDHALEWFPSVRVLAADGLHPNFEGVALMTGHMKQLRFRNATNASSSSWLDHMPSGTMKQASDAYQPSPCATCVLAPCTFSSSTACARTLHRATGATKLYLHHSCC
ncbi:hypothetical protein MTO96_039064 [Rhipicephalus appendiculatus]